MSLGLANILPGLPVTTNDYLFVNIWNSNQTTGFGGNTSNKGIRLKAILLQGGTEVEVTKGLLGFGTARVKSSRAYQLPYGNLLSVHLDVDNAGVLRGECYAQVALLRDPTGFSTSAAGGLAQNDVPLGGNIFADLASGYLGDDVSPGWTWPSGAVFEHPLSGEGKSYGISGPAPLAGAEVADTVPTNARWRIDSIVQTFTTTLTAGTRQPGFLTLDDGATIFFSNPTRAPTTTLTGTTFTIFYLRNWSLTETVYDANNSIRLPLPELPRFRAGFRLKTKSTTFIGSDTYASTIYEVMEWMEPTD